MRRFRQKCTHGEIKTMRKSGQASLYWYWFKFFGNWVAYFKVLSWILRGGTKESHEKPQSVQPISKLIFESRTNQIQRRRIKHSTATFGNASIEASSDGPKVLSENECLQGVSHLHLFLVQPGLKVFQHWNEVSVYLLQLKIWIWTVNSAGVACTFHVWHPFNSYNLNFVL
jgi:hypothetical protein